MSNIQLVYGYSWTVASLFMEFSRQEYWSGLPFPTPGDCPDPGIQPASSVSPSLAGGSSSDWAYQSNKKEVPRQEKLIRTTTTKDRRNNKWLSREKGSLHLWGAHNKKLRRTVLRILKTRETSQCQWGCRSFGNTGGLTASPHRSS